MGKDQLSDSSVRLLRRISVITGIILFVASLLANNLGMSISGGLSRNQIMILIGGLALITAGILGRKFPSVYKGIALLVLNVIVVLLILDILALVLLKLIDRRSFEILKMKRELGNLEMVQHNTVLGRYEPYVIWKADNDLAPVNVRVSDEGYRVTPGVSEADSTFTIYLLGGSAMWGAGVSDSCTIAVYLNRYLEEETGDSFKIINMGQQAFSSTQELIELALRLRDGSVPDLVIFYDGFNDVWGAYANGFAGGHHSQAQVAARVEGRSPEFQQQPPLKMLLENSNVWLLIQVIRNRFEQGDFDISDLITYRTMGVDVDSLAEDVVHIYLGNCRVADALGDEYGFDCIYIWQPSIWIGDKPLTEFEQTVFAGGFEAFQGGGDPAFKDLLRTTYRIYEDSVEFMSDHYSFSSLFDGAEEEFYCDYSGAHVNGHANSIIAEEIGRLIMEGPIGLNLLTTASDSTMQQ